MLRRLRQRIGHWLLRDYCKHRYTFWIQKLPWGYETHECFKCGDWLLVDTKEE